MKILIVEKQDTVMSFLTRILNNYFQNEFEIFTANNCNDAMDIVLSEEVDIIISDWTMPEMDGLALCKQVRSHNYIGENANIYPYFVMLTGQDNIEDMVKAFEYGIDDYIKKPFQQEEIYARLVSARRNIELQKTNEEERQLLKELNKQLDHLSKTDILTGAYNRFYFLQEISQQWIKSIKNKNDLGVLIIDIDHFKRINDTFGHIAGDEVIRKTAQKLKEISRGSDYVCRFGGEEFIIICPETNKEQLSFLAERIKKVFNEGNILEDCLKQSDKEQANRPLQHLTVSIGGATKGTSNNATGYSELINLADKNLYKVKNSGRNNYLI